MEINPIQALSRANYIIEAIENSAFQNARISPTTKGYIFALQAE